MAPPPAWGLRRHGHLVWYSSARACGAWAAVEPLVAMGGAVAAITAVASAPAVVPRHQRCAPPSSFVDPTSTHPAPSGSGTDRCPQDCPREHQIRREVATAACPAVQHPRRGYGVVASRGIGKPHPDSAVPLTRWSSWSDAHGWLRLVLHSDGERDRHGFADSSGGTSPAPASLGDHGGSRAGRIGRGPDVPPDRTGSLRARVPSARHV